MHSGSGFVTSEPASQCDGSSACKLPQAATAANTVETLERTEEVQQKERKSQKERCAHMYHRKGGINMKAVRIISSMGQKKAGFGVKLVIKIFIAR